MELSEQIEAYTIFYTRCTEVLTELNGISLEGYRDGLDSEARNRLCYYSDLLFRQAESLKELGINVEMHDAFKNYAEEWKKNPTVAEVA